MTNKFIQNTIVAILENNIGISKKAITANASFYKDLGLDSLDVAELIMEIELVFGIDVRHKHFPQSRDLSKNLKF